MKAGSGEHPVTLFFAGTDTDIGKTHCAALAARQLVLAGRTVGVYKPVASGCQGLDDDWLAEDAQILWEAAGKPRTLTEVCPQRFGAPLAPPEAARLEGRSVDETLLLEGAEAWLTSGFDVLIVEGAGGLMSPLADGCLNIDLFRRFGAAHLLIVAANRLGVVHQVLSTCEAATNRGVKPAGIILSQVTENADASVARNAEQIRRHTAVPILGEVGYGDSVTKIELDRFFPG